MKSKEERLLLLLNQYLNNQLSEEDYREFWVLMHDNAESTVVTDTLQQLWQQSKSAPAIIAAEEWSQKLQSLKDGLPEDAAATSTVQTPVVGLRRYWWAAAAVLLVGISTTLYWVTNNRSKAPIDIAKKSTPNNLENDRQPGTNKAMLTLADGSQIVLDSAHAGLLAQQGNTQIVKLQNGQLVYNQGATNNSTIAYNRLSTPRGGQYQLTLPDGSKVWLNAASSITYPSAFTGYSRNVTMTGEAYFEIAKNGQQPFTVTANDMTVQVLGTHFNINAYADEEVARTTLLEGRVKIAAGNDDKMLIPGQQAQWKKSGNITLAKQVDVEEVMAWKDGIFQFDNTDIQTVMRQIARWYDVEVVYKGNISKHFIGSISRQVKLSQVLSMLQQTSQIKFVIEGNKVIVTP